MKASKKKTITVIVFAILSALLWATMFACITEQPDMKTWIRVIFIVSSTLLFIYSIVVALLVEFHAGPYKCKKCGHIHHVDFVEFFLSPHFGFTKLVKCERCKKDTWHTKEFK